MGGVKNINEIRPGIKIIETSVKSGVGLDEWLGYLQEKREVL
jgi:Ni2+-binding GTPase involved in maturation of urease and hydrogenase